MIGRTLAHYEIVALLGRGGMGEVYRAQDTRLGREVALKLLPEEFATDPERLARFRREARVLASLNHPNIAAVHGFEEVEGRVFLVMELAEGEELEQRLIRGAVPVDEVIAIARQMAEGLREAHDKGIVHRDLKPANVKIGPDGQVKILDFGLARAVLGDPSEGDDPANSPTITAAMTQQGVVLGTAAYMSPEQARGRTVDQRADVWAFGVIVFEMLTGQRLFAGDTTSDTLAAVLRQDFDLDQLPPGTPPALRFVLSRCLERDRERRLRDVAEARWLLSDEGAEDLLPSSREGVAAVETGPEPRPSHGRVVLPWALVVVLVAALVWTLLRPGVVPTGSGPRPVRFTQLTAQGGRELYPSLSPDASFFVYAGRGGLSGGGSGIYLQRAGGMKPITLTAEPGVLDDAPALSPDGERVAFYSSREPAGIYVMGATGESVRSLVPGGSHPAWSPDGRQLAYCTEHVTSPSSRNKDSVLWVLDLDSGERRQLAGIDAVQPAWSPGGGRIAFWSTDDATGGQRDIWTVSVDGGDPRRVTEDQPLDWSPVWSADGAWLYFASDRGGVMNLWRVPIDETSGEVLGAAEPLTLATQELDAFSISQDGTRLVYSSVSTSANLYALDLRAQGVRPEPRPVLVGSILVSAPDVSPDGRSIVFRRLGEQEDLYLIGADGSDLSQITNDPYRDRGPSWIDGGSEIVFYSDRSGRYQLWTVRPDGSGLRQRTRTEGRAYWFPRKSSTLGLVTGINENGTTVLRVDEATGDYVDPRSLPDPAEGQRFYADSWSPDGRLLAGRASPGPGSRASAIWIYDPASEEYRRLANDGGPWADVRWSPDGREVMYTARDGIRVVDFDGGETRLLFESGSFAPSGFSFSLSPDGRTAYTAVPRTESDLWMAVLED